MTINCIFVDLSMLPSEMISEVRITPGRVVVSNPNPIAPTSPTSPLPGALLIQTAPLSDTLSPTPC